MNCEYCNGYGLVGGPAGQTPETLNFVSEPCPDCGGSGVFKLTDREAALFDVAWNLVVAVNGGGPLPHKTVAERAEEATAVLMPLLDARNAAEARS